MRSFVQLIVKQNRDEVMTSVIVVNIGFSGINPLDFVLIGVLHSSCSIGGKDRVNS